MDPHPVFEHLYKRDKTAAENCLSPDRVKILEDNNLIVLSTYTLELLQTHYRRAEDLTEVVNLVHKIMDENSIQRIHPDGSLYDTPGRVKYLVHEYQEADYSVKAISRHLDNLGVPSGGTTKEGEVSSWKILTRVVYLCATFRGVRKVIETLKDKVHKANNTSCDSLEALILAAIGTKMQIEQNKSSINDALDGAYALMEFKDP